ncbi:efflux RND transporter periplasmic adaptor subunit [uncultured Desulfobacter sp.]|uniref:efflux RND transporter periplasmic adaptor subunit n=1 Tax=uncultured Desulfobacter sp. TaxID=240139 RepID=UPI0029F48CEB|nr:efflux RND transporter periplasmic adaptor subunit [uncultured Desulfobacter sp.]
MHLMFILMMSLLAGVGVQAQEASTALAAVAVQTSTVIEQTVPTLVEVVGTLQAVERAAIAAKVTGVVTDVPVVLGSRVTKGDLLVEISAREIAAQLNQARARLNQAGRNLTRERNLLKKHATTAETVKSMQDQYAVANAAVQEARTMLSYASISAPFSGVITAKSIHAGDLATSGTVLLRMENDQKLQAVCAVPESLVLQVQPEQTLTVTIPTVGLTIEAKVAEVAPSADPASRTAPVTIDLPYNEKLRTGQFARVKLPGQAKTSLFVPDGTVLPQGQMERVFVAGDNKAHLRLVRTGMRQGGFTEILAGLNPGETVIVKNNEHLVDGQPIKTQTEKSHD